MPTKRVTLGIHSTLDGTASSPDYRNFDNMLARFTDGHAWISVTEGGITTRYGLWPDKHLRTKDNGAGSDIRKNMEPMLGKVNRYYRLSPWQTHKLLQLLTVNTTWSETNNCASWTSKVAHEVTNKDIDADDWLGFETPRELARSISKLENKKPTSLTSPINLKGGI
jgi:hypothetical protein